jgi:hypothetical protein
MADAPDGCKNRRVVGVACAANRDCGTGKCGVDNTCEVLTPADTCLGDAFAFGAVALLETDVDCGGKQCREAYATCADAQYCDANGDYTSGRAPSTSASPARTRIWMVSRPMATVTAQTTT